MNPSIFSDVLDKRYFHLENPRFSPGGFECIPYAVDGCFGALAIPCQGDVKFSALALEVLRAYLFLFIGCS